LAAGSIRTWDEMTTKFLKKFFPAHKTRQLRREILTFQQREGALFFEAWEHFNELLLRCPHHNLSQEDQILEFYEGLNDPNKSLVDLACGYMLMEKSSEEAIELFETLSENSQQFPSKGRQGLKGKGIDEESTNGGIQAQMAAMEKKLDMLMKAMINHNSAPESSLINFSQHYHENEPSSTYWPQQYQEEECQSQFVANYNGQYMEEECTYYLVQTTTTLRNEEIVEENFCEPSLEDPLGERFNQFCEQSVVENQVDERKEEQIEDLEEPHQEKEESTKTFSTLALILETPRGQERSLLELPNEQIEDIKIEKLPKSSSYFILVHDEKLFEKTQICPPVYTDNWNPPTMGRHHSLWFKRRKDWCFKFKVPTEATVEVVE
jgi:tetratricopeptide (TPR) repeat protein